MNSDAEPMGGIAGSQLDAQGCAHIVRQSADALLQAQDHLISALPIPCKKANPENDFDAANADVLNIVAFNFSIINSVRLRNSRLLISAGLPLLAINEFDLLTALTFEELDSFYRALAEGLGARASHNWYVEKSEFIAKLFSGYGDDILTGNYMLFTATRIECALVDKDYELAEFIADSCNATPPFEQRFLEWLCIAYWLVDDRSTDACKWSEIAIANQCKSHFPYIIKCRSLLVAGDIDGAISCLDQAERFFYSIGLKDAYAAILRERSVLMDSASAL
jgi:hypothetical protein